jgi:hypothetical protein
VRYIVDQSGIKWSVSIDGPGASLGDESLPEQISVITLLFKSSSGEVRYKSVGERPLESFSNDELIKLLNKDDEYEV